jgi:hypothetical protein
VVAKVSCTDIEVLDPHAQADALAVALSARGLVTAVYKKFAHQLNPVIWCFSEQTEYAEFIYVATDKESVWRFWWSEGLDPIASAEEVSFAADEITRRIHVSLRLVEVRAILVRSRTTPRP